MITSYVVNLAHLANCRKESSKHLNITACLLQWKALCQQLIYALACVGLQITPRISEWLHELKGHPAEMHWDSKGIV